MLPAKATKLVAVYGGEVVCETAEYLAAQSHGSRKNVENPAGLIIYSLENALPVPASFMSSRKRKAAEGVQERKRLKDAKAFEKEFKRLKKEMAYSNWTDKQRDLAVRELFTEAELASKLAKVCLEESRRDERFRRMPDKAKKETAYRLVKKELAAAIQLPTLEEWQVTSEQARLF